MGDEKKVIIDSLFITTNVIAFVNVARVVSKCFMLFQNTESEHINLKVLGQDNAVVQFKIKKGTPLRKLMSAYCDRAVSSVSFLTTLLFFRISRYTF